jgi:hypothetical protein
MQNFFCGEPDNFGSNGAGNELEYHSEFDYKTSVKSSEYLGYKADVSNGANSMIVWDRSNFAGNLFCFICIKICN